VPDERGYRRVRAGGRRWLPRFRHPAQVIAVAFVVTVIVGTGLLMLPVAREGPGSAPLVTALFTATSAVCVTGLIVVDTPVYWSPFGQVAILVMIQVGGFGIMTLASLVGLLISRRLGLRSRLIAAAETKHIGLGDVGRVIRGVIKVSLLFEALTAVMLTARFALGYDQGFVRAIELGVFHAISAFNNAGFALFSDSLIGFAGDPWICLPIAVAVIFGGIGFPVLFELRRQFARPRQWSLHSKLTIGMTVALLISSTVFVMLAEWANPRTLGQHEPDDRVLSAFFYATMLRSGGFHSFDPGQLSSGTLLGSDVLMFIGGGSAGTAGGIKVTTFVLLLFVIWAEVRGDADVTVLDRRVEPRVWRQALSVALLSVAAVVISTFVLVQMTQISFDRVLFESVSAFATNGLSTGITATLPPAGQLLLIVLMFVGRLGPISLVSALALRERNRLFHVPEGRPLIG
jgi:trk system potassium uptake protein TrkH